MRQMAAHGLFYHVRFEGDCRYVCRPAMPCHAMSCHGCLLITDLMRGSQLSLKLML